jgi:Family of unknown function (DUF6055)
MRRTIQAGRAFAVRVLRVAVAASVGASGCGGGGAGPAAGGAGAGSGAGASGGAGSGGTGASSGMGGSGGGEGGPADPGPAQGGNPGSGATGSDGGEPAGSCDPGATTTTWASGCATTAPASARCVSGTWSDPGSTTNDPLQCQSAHFAVHAPSGAITAAQCTAATDELENVIWPMRFGSPMFEPEPFCASSSKSKVSIVIHSDYGLTGGCWGNGLPGMWVGPGATADHWGLAHEFTHAWQCSVGTGLQCGSGPNTCGWIFESHANWSAQQLPEYHASNVHCSEMLANAPHLYLGSTRDRYCNWQFMEYLKDKYCYQAVNDIWLASTTSADPFTNIMKTRGWSIGQLNDFFGDWAMHGVTWDYEDPAPEATAGANQGSLYRSNYGLVTDRSQTQRRLRLVQMEPLDAGYATDRRFVSPYYWAPQRWGYNVVRLYPDAGATSVTVKFRGVVQSGADADFRWGLVATDAGITTPRYSALQKGTDGELAFCVTPAESLFLVVVATPAVQQAIVWDQAYPTIYRYPYMMELGSAWPEGYQGGAPAACPSGLTRVNNGGGCGPSNLPSSVYVGPYATVLSGATVTGSARIEDHATVVHGTVSGGTVGALTLVGSTTAPYNANPFDISGSAQAQTTFYPLGWFESGQSLSGTARLFGDIEFRGQGFSESSGSFYGYVDDTIAAETIGDVTGPPPYTWRP